MTRSVGLILDFKLKLTSTGAHLVPVSTVCEAESTLDGRLENVSSFFDVLGALDTAYLVAADLIKQTKPAPISFHLHDIL